MCLVYVYNCRVCFHQYRNYKRWPVFCKKEYCTKLYDELTWCNDLPCHGQPCTIDKCGVIQQKRDFASIVGGTINDVTQKIGRIEKRQDETQLRWSNDAHRSTKENTGLCGVCSRMLLDADISRQFFNLYWTRRLSSRNPTSSIHLVLCTLLGQWQRQCRYQKPRNIVD